MWEELTYPRFAQYLYLLMLACTLAAKIHNRISSTRGLMSRLLVNGCCNDLIADIAEIVQCLQPKRRIVEALLVLES